MAQLRADTKIGGINILETLNQKADKTQLSDFETTLSNLEFDIEIRRPISFDQVKFIGHRGFSWLAPENSKHAFYFTATKRGSFWGCETDLHFTADNEIVCIHDPTLDRTTNGTGNVKDLTLADIRSYSIDFTPPSLVPTNELYIDKKVPTLEEYLQIMNEINVVPVMELKADGDFEKLYYIIKRLGFEDKCVVVSFYPEFLQAVRRLSPKIKMMYLTNYFTSNEIDICLSIGNCGINVNHSVINSTNVNIARTHNLEIGVWTVNDIPTIEHARRLGVDYITTDYGAGRFLNKQKRISLTTINGKLGVSQAYSSEDATLEWHSGYQAVKVTYEYPFRSMIGGTGGTAYLSRHIVTDNLGYKFSTRGETYDHLFLQVKKDGNIINPLEGLSDTIWVNILVDSY